MNKTMKKAMHFGKKLQQSEKSVAKQKCIACNGSGYYDSNGSPKCASCGGTGLEYPTQNDMLTVI